MLNKILNCTKINYQNRIPQIISEIPIKEIPEGWALIYDPQKSETLAMNEIGVFIYNLIDGKRNIGEIIDHLSLEFDRPPKNIGKDVRTFIDSLVHENIASWNGIRE